MKKVLVFQNQINDIVAVGSEFPVSPEMQWMDAPDDVSSQTHQVVNGVISLKPGPTLAQAQLTQITTLEAAYTVAIQLPVSYMGSTFQADSDSQDLLTKCLVAGAVPTGFYWLDAINEKVPMTFAQLQGLAGTMLMQGQIAFDNLQTKKTAVRAALTVADVQLVQW